MSVLNQNLSQVERGNFFPKKHPYYNKKGTKSILVNSAETTTYENITTQKHAHKVTIYIYV